MKENNKKLTETNLILLIIILILNVVTLIFIFDRGERLKKAWTNTKNWFRGKAGRLKKDSEKG